MSNSDDPYGIREFFNNPPAPLNQSDIFKIFLKILKTPPGPTDPTTPIHLSEFLECRAQFSFESSMPMVIPTAIKVMESGIFYQGGLKGAENPGGGQLYESYPIQDLPVFLISLAMFLDLSSRARDAELREKKVKEGFARVQSELSFLAPLVRRAKGQRRAGQLEKARQALADLEKETLATKTIIKLKPYAVKKQVLWFFSKHIDAPKGVMAERSAELLTAFGIPSTQEGMRDLLKKK